MPLKYIALIPAYEPGSAFLDLLEQLQSLEFEIIVVNDGSSASFTPLFENAHSYATVLSHDTNHGKGAALKTGFSYILNHYPCESIIVTIDADGQHRVQDALHLCHIAQKHPDSLILGSRGFKGKVPVKSLLGNMLTRLIFRFSTGVSVSDTQTGLRACSANLLPRLINIPGERYEYEMNVLLDFSRNHIPLIEQEIETIYLNNNVASHFNPIRDSYRIYKELLKFSASSFIGFLVDYILYGVLLLITAPFDATLGLRLSNIGARLVSACVNFTLNRKFVFKSKRNVVSSAIQYFLLASVILFGNTIVLEFFVDQLGFHRMAAKIVTEILFFTISWFVQRLIIFRKKDT